jgi:hypothetical protein
MNHFKKGAKMALLGENYFPPMSNSHVTYRRGKSLQKIMSAILHHSPSVVYICPTKGVNINILPLLLMNNVKIRIIMPSKAFFTTLNAEEKVILDAACQSADKIIILSEKKSDPLRFAEDWYQASRRAIKSSDWVLLAHSTHTDDKGFDELVMRFEKNPKPVLAVDFGEEE